MGRNFYAVNKRPTLDEPIHIGKASAGWKFLFQGYNGINNELVIQNIEDWKEFLSREDMVILDEYERKYDYDEFFAFVEEKQLEHHPDDFKYAVNRNGYRFTYSNFS